MNFLPKEHQRMLNLLKEGDLEAFESLLTEHNAREYSRKDPQGCG